MLPFILTERCSIVYCSVEKSQSELVESCSLRLEECLSAERSPSTEHIQGYVKKVSLRPGRRRRRWWHLFDAVAGGRGNSVNN